MIKEENGYKNFMREKVLSYKPDFNLEILEKGLEQFDVSHCDAGDFILKAGEICKRIFMVENSITRCYFTDSNGDEKTIWLEPEKMVITDYESFSSQTVSRCDILCYEATNVYSIEREKLMMLYLQYHDWALFGLSVMEEHFCRVLEFRNIISFNNANDNYHLLESYFSQYLDKVPLKHLASWLNISAVHLSRIRKERAKINSN